MRKRQLHFKGGLALLAITTIFWLDAPANAQSTPAQDSRPVQDNDATRQELARFDQFLDSHREIAEQLRRDPSLVNNEEFVKNHPALQTYLQDHPAIRTQIKENPNAFMRAEDRLDRREDNRGINREELARFDQFLDNHREIAEQLRKDPSLVDNSEYVKNHPELQTYLQDHPAIRTQIKENPNAFMRAEDRFDYREDNRDRDVNREEVGRFNQFLDNHREIAEQLRKDPSLVDNGEFVKNHPALQTYLQDHPGVRTELKENPNAFVREEDRLDHREDNRGRDVNREELAHFDQFLDSHREIAEQLRKDPSLVDNGEFVKNHPALQTYLQDHPELRSELKQNPNGFMQLEARNEHRDDGMDRDRDTTHRPSASFGEFLGGHSNIAEQLSKDPTLVKNKEYMENHPELQEYLNAHPDVRQELMENPQSFVKSAQQFSTNNGRTAKPPAAQPKPNQQ
jgi:hypothetical protein